MLRNVVFVIMLLGSFCFSLLNCSNTNSEADWANYEMATCSKSGFCVVVDTGENDLSCDERLEKSSDEISSVLNESLSCQNSEDCTTVDIGTGCQGACPVAVARSGAQTVEETIENANNKYCQNYQEDGCSYVTPRCALWVPVCDNEKCDLVEPE